MNRANFLKGLAAVAASLGITGMDLKDDEKWIDLDLKCRIRRDRGPDRIESVDEIEWTQRVPADLNPESWAQLGVDEYELYRLALSSYLIRAQMVCRVRYREGETAEEAILAAQNYTPRKRIR